MPFSSATLQRLRDKVLPYVAKLSPQFVDVHFLPHPTLRFLHVLVTQSGWSPVFLKMSLGSTASLWELI
jgi:hypothetical protein